MCELLTVMDPKIVTVALNGLENILKAGNQHKVKPNPYAMLIEECYGTTPPSPCPFLISLITTFKLSGLDKIEFLQSHQNKEIYEKVFNIIQTYFSNDEEDVAVAPSAENNQFQFNADQSVPMDGYQF